jgi:hypothetical protein
MVDKEQVTTEPDDPDRRGGAAAAAVTLPDLQLIEISGPERLDRMVVVYRRLVYHEPNPWDPSRSEPGNERFHRCRERGRRASPVVPSLVPRL